MISGVVQTSLSFFPLSSCRWYTLLSKHCQVLSCFLDAETVCLIQSRRWLDGKLLGQINCRSIGTVQIILQFLESV